MNKLHRWIDEHVQVIAVASFLTFLGLGLAMIFIDAAMGYNEFSHWLY
jgi:hypothetical protein